MMSFAKRKKLVSTSDSSVSMSVHLRATRDMQPTAMTYNEEEQSRLPQSRPCPLTNLAREYGAEEGKGYAFDTVLPERITRQTFRMFGTMLALAVVIYTVREFWR